MKTTLNKESVEHCPRCHEKFECRPNDISACHCSKVELSAEEYRFINADFKDCLCNSCLKAMKEEYQMNKSNIFKKGTFGFLIIFLLVPFANSVAQIYAPPVGQAGTSAIYKDSSVFVSWAKTCLVTRGYQDISNTSLGLASVGDNSMGTGKAFENGVVSLGDGGSAICTFEKPLRNGAGNDFAVFENGFDDTFLELAFVEVSSDGINFFRFPSHSLTDTVNQTNGFGPTDAKKINNLAGKYRGGYGTPFDLQDLTGTVGLDLESITHVKLVDVVGSLNKEYASRDFHNNKVNDPWPTPFPSSGFDFDAIGVIHQSAVTGIEESKMESLITVYPNPLSPGNPLKISSDKKVEHIELMDAQGTSLGTFTEQELSVFSFSNGLYFLKIYTAEGYKISKVLVL